MAFSLFSPSSLAAASSSGTAPSSAKTLLSSSACSIVSFPFCKNFTVSTLSARSHGFRSSLLIRCCSDPGAAPSALPSNGEEDNRNMQRQMRNPYEYHHDLGVYYTRILDNLIVGSQPQTENDIDRLYQAEGVRAILNLQQDREIEFWKINLNAITKRCNDVGIQYMRPPAKVFDSSSPRNELIPRAVALLDYAISQGKTVYVHCIGGLGRAPAVAIAYLFWFNGMNLDGAFNFVTTKRTCRPKKEAIRGATYDLAKTDAGNEPFEELAGDAFTDVTAWERRLIQEKIRSMR